MSPISGWVFDRIGARMLAIVGLIITAVTTWEFSKLTLDTPYSHLIWLYIFRMFGMSMLGMPIMTEGLNALPRHLYSHGTAMSNTIRQVAASLGTAFLVTIMSNRTKFHVEAYRNEMTENNPLFMSLVGQLKQAIPSDEAIAQLLYGLVQQRSTVEGINDAFFVATGLTVLALMMAFLLKGKKSINRHRRKQRNGCAAPVRLALGKKVTASLALLLAACPAAFRRSRWPKRTLYLPTMASARP